MVLGTLILTGSTANTTVDTEKDAERFPERQQGVGYRTQAVKCG
jgi:hypothetical protein